MPIPSIQYRMGSLPNAPPRISSFLAPPVIPHHLHPCPSKMFKKFPNEQTSLKNAFLERNLLQTSVISPNFSFPPSLILPNVHSENHYWTVLFSFTPKKI